MAVQRIVGGIEIEDDLLGPVAVCREKHIDKQRLDRGRIPGDAVVAGQRRPAQLQPVEVDLPASGAQSLRRAASLPASTASVGSWRSWS
jgi:hypothetical protein